jgi:NitT/TauT family transport system permease protein
MRRLYRHHERAALGTLAVVLALVVWEGLPRGWWGKPIDAVFVSSPLAIVSSAFQLFASGEIWPDLGVSGLEFAAGFALAVLAGVVLGVIAGWNRWVFYALDPFFSALNATPRVALLPLVIIWVGIGIWSKILVVFLGAVIPVYLNVLAGVRTTDARLVRVATSFGASRAHLFRTIVLPGAVPYLVTGLRLGVGRAMVGIVVGELYAATAGVGFMITVAGASFQTDKVFVGVILIAIAGGLMIEALGRAERRFDTWRPAPR